jgi:ketosteroid isomerase-like protein
MKRINYTIGIILGLSLILSSHAQSKTEESVLAVELQRFQAMTQRDTSALRNMLADDLCYIHSNALVENKAQHLAAIAKGSLVYQNMQREQVQTRLYKKIALTNGIVLVKGLLNGTAFDLKLRYTATYRKKKGRWLLANWQSTRIP